MKLSTILTKERIARLPDAACKTKEQAVETLLSTLWDNSELKNGGVAKDALLKEVLNREAEQSTGVGEGFAFPHARVSGLKCESQIVFAIAPCGVDFSSFDGQPCKFIMLSIVQETDPNTILRARAALIGALASKSAQGKFLAAPDSEALWKLIDDSGANTKKDVLAQDLMTPPPAVGRPDMTLREAALEMFKNKLNAMPVVDKDGVFLGEITTHELLAFGIPEFFLNLKTVSFVRHMDPCEKYFSKDLKMTLADLKTVSEASALPPDATLMEIVFEMAAKRRRTVNVIDADGKLIGLITRLTIVEKVLLTA